jgi:hypothetical protein
LDYLGSDANVDGSITMTTEIVAIPGGRFKASTEVGGKLFEAVDDSERLAQIALEEKLETARQRGQR